MIINPIQPNTQTTVLPVDSFPGQKMERSQDAPRPIVERKQEAPSAREEIPREEVEKAADKLNRMMNVIEKRWKIGVHEDTNRIMVTIIDKDSGEVLNELPPKKILDLIASFSEMTGLLVDEKV